MLRALFNPGSFWTIINEKTFRDRGSGFMNEIFPKGSAWMYGEFMKLSETMFKNIQWN